MLETGFVIFLGAVLILAKLPRRLLLRALHRPLAIDLTVSALVYAIHWGTSFFPCQFPSLPFTLCTTSSTFGIAPCLLSGSPVS